MHARGLTRERLTDPRLWIEVAWSNGATATGALEAVDAAWDCPLRLQSPASQSAMRQFPSTASGQSRPSSYPRWRRAVHI